VATQEERAKLIKQRIKAMSMEDIQNLPPEIRAEVMKKKLSMGAGPLRLLSSATPAGFIRKNAVNLISRIAAAKAGGGGSVIPEDYSMLPTVASDIGRNATIQTINRKRFEEEKKKFKKEGRDLGKWDFGHKVADFWFPGIVDWEKVLKQREKKRAKKSSK
jgi:hypothetical protein